LTATNTPPILLPLVWVALAFLCGSLPFSVWLGKLATGKDVRQVGDGNPGATNVFRAGSKLVGTLVLILDIAKGAFPVGMAYYVLGFSGLAMFLVATAPLLGHVFSPFLGFRGGKGIAVAFGVWIGLTVWKLSLPALLIVVIGNALFTPPGWSVMLALGGILAGILVWLPAPLLLAVWAAQTIILAWTHRHDLRSGMHLRPWLAKRLSRLGRKDAHD
jgi:acyl phosphate:glycerol-3-phosphate acyltransferase